MSLTERIHSDHGLVKHLGNWTEAGRFELKVRHGAAVLDLRSPGLPDDLSGSATNSEIRIHRGGIAILSAMLSRAYVQDVRRAHKTGGVPTIDDLARGHQS
ncbi:hypothetical protein [Streptomyces sp. NPDC060031]|uniref:hypothetical protein n=1 Tax=Streptomyces sp. NPDC060031 TaxID=3347043 RepID=UPI00368A5394